MKVENRRTEILNKLKTSNSAVSASALAKFLGVTRQIIVGDIALLRASGIDILATPRGYIINNSTADGLFTKTIVCCHLIDKTEEEIYTIIDNGGILVNVIVEHPLYGQLAGELHISSRYDADNFINKLKKKEIMLLSALTDGLHLHTVKYRTESDFKRIEQALKEKNILFCPEY